ncbi:MAG: hypothetical protein QOD99_2037 [Chthoniobacter sp.]|jgi:catechol 2,3-dioxygenase-like lactoylglutathione lyase family enzyme|nr:hypothetical protein [Chthoniobacter sp.]
MKLQAPIPTFRIFDYALAKAFYVDWLGFRIDWEHQFSPTAPRYIQISRDAAVLHLTEHYGDCTPGAKAFIHLDDLAELHHELQNRPNANMNPGIEEAPWQARIMEVTDPFGNRLCFNQSLLKWPLKGE